MDDEPLIPNFTEFMNNLEKVTFTEYSIDFKNCTAEPPFLETFKIDWTSEVIWDCR